MSYEFMIILCGYTIIIITYNNNNLTLILWEPNTIKRIFDYSTFVSLILISLTVIKPYLFIKKKKKLLNKTVNPLVSTIKHFKYINKYLMFI